MIKTCELQTCNGLHTVELQDILYCPDSKTIKRVSGETIISLPIDLDSISTRLSYLENIIHNNADENVYQEIEKELNNIRDLINTIESEFQTIEGEFTSIKLSLNNIQSNALSSKTFSQFVYDFNNWKNSIQSQVNVNTADIQSIKLKLDSISQTLTDKLGNIDLSNIIDQINSNTNEIDNLKTQLNDLSTDFNKLSEKVTNLDQQLSNPDSILSKELTNGGLSFKNVNGKTILKFNSSVNYGSDYGFIEYDDDNDTYNFWGNSNENSALIVGVQNDGKNSVSDVVVLKSPASVIVDSKDLIFRDISTGNRFSILDKLGLGIPDYNSGWISVNQNGLKLSNPLGQNAFFIGYIKYDNGDIMQFGVYSGYEDDDSVDAQDTGVYLVIQPTNLIIAVRKRSNDGTPSAVGLSDGISYSTNIQNTFQAKIIGWKLPNGVV